MNYSDGVTIHIGFDDIDSPSGGCTTHLVYKLVLKWGSRSIKFIDYPGLIRLNPAIPWKTRGNGAVVLRLKVRDIDKAMDLYEEAISEINEYVSEFMHPESAPAIAFYIGEVEDKLKWLGYKAVRDVIPLDLLYRVLAKLRNTFGYHSFSEKRKRGIIGAFSAIGVTLQNTDYTYELIAYRKPEYWGKPRYVTKDSVKFMDKTTRGYTYVNYDYEEDKPLITPHGPDPVLLGIRGDEPGILVKAYNMLEINEPVDGWIIYRTNQLTDMHLRRITQVSKAYIYTGVILKARVSRRPRRIIGGHVIFSITDGISEIDVAAYEPTGGFRNIVEKLEPGDVIEVYGVVRPPSSRHGATINLEKIRIIDIAPKYRFEAPRCPKCGARMKSMGRGKGYRCPKCRYRDSSARKIAYPIPRTIKPGFYQVPPRSFKHLMKPIERFGKEKHKPPQKLYSPWHYP
ncbi:MAG: DUF1743 domain-containing protein [Desulfurococcales archaeon]|nr:DUF1743 domain-containing protein [Desulfurococcales archaeon]